MLETRANYAAQLAELCFRLLIMLQLCFKNLNPQFLITAASETHQIYETYVVCFICQKIFKNSTLWIRTVNLVSKVHCVKD